MLTGSQTAGFSSTSKQPRTRSLTCAKSRTSSPVPQTRYGSMRDTALTIKAGTTWQEPGSKLSYSPNTAVGRTMAILVLDFSGTDSPSFSPYARAQRDVNDHG